MKQSTGTAAGRGGLPESGSRVDTAATGALAERSAAVLFRIHPATFEVLQVSANIEIVLGYRADELVGTADVWRRIRPGGCRRAREAIETAVSERRAGVTMPLRVLTLGGELRDVLVSARLQYDEHGGALDVVCVLLDLTAEMRASEAALATARREQELAARMRTAAEGALGLLTAATLQELETLLRRAARRVIEFDVFRLAVYDPNADTLAFVAGADAGILDQGEVVPLAGTPFERVVRDRRSVLTRNAADALARGGRGYGALRRSESAVRTPILAGDAVRAVISVQSFTPAQYDAHDLAVLEALAAGAAGALARLDERRRAEAEAGHGRHAAILEALPDFVAAINPEQRTLFLNRGGRRLLGIPEDEPLEHAHFSAFVPPAAFEMLRSRAIPEALRHGTWSGDAALLTRARLELPVHQTITAHFAADGSLAFLSTIARDLSAQRRLEQQRSQAQKMEAIGRLAGGIAHDFNNLLTAVTGHSALLLDALPPSDPLRLDAEEIRRAGERAALLTRQLLAFSRQQVLRPVSMDLNKVIEEMSGMLQGLVGSDVVLRSELAASGGPVRADPAQIQQVVLNLVVNARDAMPEGGMIVLATESVDLPRPDLPLPPDARPGSYHVLSVRDSGSGMDAETLSRIFEPFFTTKEQGKGTGLGLSTVYGIVEQSHGFLDVQSRPGAGTVFRVFLPHSREQPAGTRGEDGMAAPSDERSGAADTTVLIAEDDAAVRALARRVLQRQGYHVLEARDGKDALQVAAAYGGRIDLLLTDVVMPESGGPELARRLTAERPEVKVVYTSGYTQDEAVRHGILQAAVPFLPKPFAPAALVRVVEQALQRAAPGRDAAAHGERPGRADAP